MSAVVFLALAGCFLVFVLVGVAVILLLSRGSSAATDPAFVVLPPFPPDEGILPHAPETGSVFPPPIPDHSSGSQGFSADTASLSETGHSFGGTAAAEAASTMESSSATDFGSGSSGDFGGGGSDSGSTSGGDGGSSSS